ncbi:alcohol oxidase [Fistulina hepatica ATCC 64428]|uniref:Alcohol oxidase n=1 Tax=Fistulina hepatica ATCC 64428 TaxID=1128425 RepID=A0A0D7AK94_9AGAR|nr:alcohol oxidase [Fistulina hepatica ATCC 64428]
MSKYDIVFAGGGTAACVTAGRLAAADPSLKILLIESGEHTKGLDTHSQPARYFSHLGPTSKTVTFNIGRPSEHLGGRSLVTPSGRCVGGGSSVNFMMYTRASASDYDDWETIYENPGWGSKDLVPLLKKCETFQVAADKLTHGYDGPLKVSYGGAYTEAGKQFMDVVAVYDKERRATDDVNGLYKCDAYGTGCRSDTANHYIYNHTGSKVEILTGQRVKRIIFEDDTAVGVEYVADTVLRPDADQTAKTAFASRLVVLAAGTFGSPTILERSGIGRKDILTKYSIDLRVELPGVGENYQDHNVIFAPYLASEETDTLDGLFRGDAQELHAWNEVWQKNGQGLMAQNGLDAGIKMRPKSKDLEELGPEFSERWKEYFESAPDKPVMWLGTVAAYLGDHSLAPPRKYISLGYFVEYPLAMGSVHIKFADDPHMSHDFDPAFLRDPADIAVLRWGYKKGREIIRRMPVYRGEYLSGHPKFKEGSAAACQSEAKSVPTGAPDIVYTEEDDRAIDEYSRLAAYVNFLIAVGTAWHSLGTCAMKPRDKGGVVDSRLNVYGVRNLKVADMSIAPYNVGSNTYSTAVVIGEKAATIIAEELGIAGV